MQMYSPLGFKVQGRLDRGYKLPFCFEVHSSCTLGCGSTLTTPPPPRSTRWNSLVGWETAPIPSAAQNISCRLPYDFFQGIVLGTQERFLQRDSILCLGFDLRVGKVWRWLQKIKSPFLFTPWAKHCARFLHCFLKKFSSLATININELPLISLGFLSGSVVKNPPAV